MLGVWFSGKIDEEIQFIRSLLPFEYVLCEYYNVKGFLRFSNSKKNKSWHEAEHYSVGCIGFLAFLKLFLLGGGRGGLFWDFKT